MSEYYSDYFLQPEKETHKEYLERFYNKIYRMTGLKNEYLRLYETFIDSASLSDGIVMYDEVKHLILEKIIRIIGNHYDDSLKEIVQQTYDRAMKEFESRGLIQQYTSLSGTIYPQIIGYNYFNDSEFYIAYRKKGDSEWNGRISKQSVTPLKILEMIEDNYEIREQQFIDIMTN